MGFYHRIIIGEIRYNETKEIIENPSKLVEEYNSLKLKVQSI